MIMLRALHRSLPFLPNGKTLIDSTSQPTLEFCLFPNHFLQRYLSSSSSAAKDDDFTVSYLMKSCGLSHEVAVSVSEKVNLQSPEGPDSVIALFKNQGFNDSHISNIVRRRPALLRSDPEKTLLPKLEFFRSIGIPIPELAAVLAAYPHHLFVSLEKTIKPCYDYLKSFIHSDKKFLYVFKRCAKFTYELHRNIPQNVALLRQCGVSESGISFFVSTYPAALYLKTDKFAETVNKVTRMGFNPSNLRFVIAVHVFAEMSESAQDRKIKAYSRWGLSEDEVQLAFLKNPLYVCISEKKIDAAMDFFVNKMGCTAVDVTRHPMILCLGLEKRIIPRCLVAKVLMVKGLIKNPARLTNLLFECEEKFMDKFVKKFMNDVPQLLDVYHGKIGLFDLGLDEQEIREVKFI